MMEEEEHTSKDDRSFVLTFKISRDLILTAIAHHIRNEDKEMTSPTAYVMGHGFCIKVKTVRSNIVASLETCDFELHGVVVAEELDFYTPCLRVYKYLHESDAIADSKNDDEEDDAGMKKLNHRHRVVEYGNKIVPGTRSIMKDARAVQVQLFNVANHDLISPSSFSIMETARQLIPEPFITLRFVILKK